MARTVVKVPYQGDFNNIKLLIEQTISSDGFELKDYNGEKVWKKGVGALTAMKYLKFAYTENEIEMSAWIQVGLGSVGGSEKNLDGFVGALPKKQLKTTLDKLTELIRQSSGKQ